MTRQSSPKRSASRRSKRAVFPARRAQATGVFEGGFTALAGQMKPDGREPPAAPAYFLALSSRPSWRASSRLSSRPSSSLPSSWPQYILLTNTTWNDRRRGTTGLGTKPATRSRSFRNAGSKSRHTNSPARSRLEVCLDSLPSATAFEHLFLHKSARSDRASKALTSLDVIGSQNLFKLNSCSNANFFFDLDLINDQVCMHCRDAPRSKSIAR